MLRKREHYRQVYRGFDIDFMANQSDEELQALVEVAVKVTDQDAATLVFSFGEFMAGEFYQRFPGFFDAADNLLDFLYSVDQIVHLEVRKLYPDAQLPEFTYNRENADEMTTISKEE